MHYGLIATSNIILSKRIDIILTEEGFTCIPIYQSSELLSILSRHPFDFAIIDDSRYEFHFPDLLPSIRALHKKLPLIILVKEEDLQKKPDDERVFYVTRDFVSQTMPATLLQILGK